MDEAKLHEFMGKLVTDMGGAAMIANVILGEELGLYRAMADSRPVTPEELAAKTGCHARLIREWLSAQAAAGYMEHSEGQFRLPPEQALALAVEDSPVYRRRWCCRVGEPLSRQGQDGRRHARQWRPRVGRASSVDVWGHRALLPAGLSRASRGRVAARPRWRRPEARGWGYGGGCRVRAWGVNGHYGAGVPGVSLFRLRLSCPLHCHGDATRQRRRGRRPCDIRAGNRQGLPWPGLRSHLLFRLSPRYGRPRRCGSACLPGTEAGRDGPAGGALCRGSASRRTAPRSDGCFTRPRHSSVRRIRCPKRSAWGWAPRPERRDCERSSGKRVLRAFAARQKRRSISSAKRSHEESGTSGGAYWSIAKGVRRHASGG